MEKLMTLLTHEMSAAFEKAGYLGELGKVNQSNRPDLCEFQCNGAMAGAKQYHKAPLMIAREVVDCLNDSELFEKAEAVAPGFINLNVSGKFLKRFIKEMGMTEKFGLNAPIQAKTIIIDYGGPNIAKPLHVGHLRSAVIGESIKRIERYAGHTVIGDVHLGDWGLQMGLIITEIRKRKPDLVYFNPDFQGEYPEEAPFTLAELEEIYPTASAKSKEDPSYKEEAMNDTYLLQHGDKGHRALWEHIKAVSISDLKHNYARLDVDFDLWKGESDVQYLIPDMVQEIKDNGFAHMSEGALVVDVMEESDTKEIPPCMILKSDGASLYNTTDLATIRERVREVNPDEILYVVDKRQELYFEQVFRCALKTGIASQTLSLKFLGFGTMNGQDGKPFKTRAGGVMRLESLLDEIYQEMCVKIRENKGTGQNALTGEEAETVASMVSLSAVKYGDLSNQASKDYVFDMERFTSFEGDTGPYILYTIVRIKSILNKYMELGYDVNKAEFLEETPQSEKMLMITISKFHDMIETAASENAPHKICAFIYELANELNHFYHETKILTEENEALRADYIALLSVTKEMLITCIHLLGFDAPERM